MGMKTKLDAHPQFDAVVILVTQGKFFSNKQGQLRGTEVCYSFYWSPLKDGHNSLRYSLWTGGHVCVRCLRCGDSQCDCYAHDFKHSAAREGGKGEGRGNRDGGTGGKERRGEGRGNHEIRRAETVHSWGGVPQCHSQHLTHIRRPRKGNIVKCTISVTEARQHTVYTTPWS